ncbi:MAG: glycoside hydrolase family 13 [Gemmatimonadota bacterium]
MSDRIRRFLDDELRLDDLTPEERSEVEAWTSLFSDLEGRWARSEPPPLEERVMGQLQDRPASAGREPIAASGTQAWKRAVRWLFEPRSVVIRPALVVAGAAAILVLAVLPLQREQATAPPQAAGPDVYVEFVLEAPDAGSVAVAGDFTGWEPEIALEDPDGDGVWSGRARLGPGVHEYMFVVDGSEWVTDPYAPRYADDGFGNRNAVLAIAGPTDDR